MNKKQDCAMKMWSFTWNLPTDFEYKDGDELPLSKVLDEWCSKWAFQLERGDEKKRLHWQGSIDLKKKIRLGGLKTIFKWPGTHWSRTSTSGEKAAFDYGMKEDTRIKGPWYDKEYLKRLKEIAKQIVDDIIDASKLYNYQQAIIKVCEWAQSDLYKPDPTINCICDTKGQIGKSTLVRFLCYHGLAELIPPRNDQAKIEEFVADLPKSRVYIVDAPRNLGGKKTAEFWCGLETLKSGMVTDTRYGAKRIIFKIPMVWVFTNEPADKITKWMSKGRIKLFWVNLEDMSISDNPDTERKNTQWLENNHGKHQQTLNMDIMEFTRKAGIKTS